MAIYKVKDFDRFARKYRISDATLRKAANDLREGRFDATLGGGLFKQRVARPGGGKSGGFRVLIARRRGEDLFFLYGFPKSARGNIGAEEEQALKASARSVGALTRADIQTLLHDGELKEISDGDA
jgi:hypothetical protein